MRPSTYCPLLILALTIAFPAMQSCTTIPETGRRSINFLPADQEMKLGLSSFADYKKKHRISGNPTYNAQLERVAAKMRRVMNVPKAQWEFVVFEDPNPNAFALPGGKVGVHTGLFQITQNDAGLAAVVGHEVAHVVARHGGERVSRSAIISGIGTVLEAGTSGRFSAGQQGAILAAYGAASTVGATLPFSRKQELEADQMGALYMARAGYDPREAVAMWQRFATYKSASGSGKPEFLSTHPVDATRIKRLQEFMPKALAEYRGAGS